MGLFDSLAKTLNSGDPLILQWFLVHNNYLPFICTFLYVLFVKRVGPDLMRKRKPFDLRGLMIVYNFTIVFIYTVSILTLLSMVFTEDFLLDICNPTLIKIGEHTYWAAYAGWTMYALKYVEFTDTIFFVLRKKQHLITNLHVIHHAALPIMGWVFIRTERSGIQFFPAGLNSFIHILMYTYYGLAAMGPEYQKHLWWKEHLTKLQMLQFVLIMLFVLVVLPLTGCTTPEHSVYIEFFAALLFLGLFYNFYINTYKKNQSQIKDKAASVTNGKKMSTSIRSDCNKKATSNGSEFFTPDNDDENEDDSGSKNAFENYLMKRCKAF